MLLVGDAAVVGVTFVSVLIGISTGTAVSVTGVSTSMSVCSGGGGGGSCCTWRVSSPPFTAGAAIGTVSSSFGTLRGGDSTCMGEGCCSVGCTWTAGGCSAGGGGAEAAR